MSVSLSPPPGSPVDPPVVDPKTTSVHKLVRNLVDCQLPARSPIETKLRTCIDSSVQPEQQEEVLSDFVHNQVPKFRRTAAVATSIIGVKGKQKARRINKEVQRKRHIDYLNAAWDGAGWIPEDLRSARKVRLGNEAFSTHLVSNLATITRETQKKNLPLSSLWETDGLMRRAISATEKSTLTVKASSIALAEVKPKGKLGDDNDGPQSQDSDEPFVNEHDELSADSDPDSDSNVSSTAGKLLVAQNRPETSRRARSPLSPIMEEEGSIGDDENDKAADDDDLFHEYNDGDGDDGFFNTNSFTFSDDVPDPLQDPPQQDLSSHGDGPPPSNQPIVPSPSEESDNAADASEVTVLPEDPILDMSKAPFVTVRRQPCIASAARSRANTSHPAQPPLVERIVHQLQDDVQITDDVLNFLCDVITATLIPPLSTVRIMDTLWFDVDEGPNMPKVPLFMRQPGHVVVFAPLHHQQPKHWTLATFHISDTAINVTFADSAPSAALTDRVRTRLTSWVHAGFPEVENVIFTQVAVPRQTDTVSYGLHVLHHIEQGLRPLTAQPAPPTREHFREMVRSAGAAHENLPRRSICILTGVMPLLLGGAGGDNARPLKRFRSAGQDEDAHPGEDTDGDFQRHRHRSKRGVIENDKDDGDDITRALSGDILDSTHTEWLQAKAALTTAEEALTSCQNNLTNASTALDKGKQQSKGDKAKVAEIKAEMSRLLGDLRPRYADMGDYLEDLEDSVEARGLLHDEKARRTILRLEEAVRVSQVAVDGAAGAVAAALQSVEQLDEERQHLQRLKVATDMLMDVDSSVIRRALSRVQS